MMFSLNMADYSMSFLLLSSLFFPSFMLKSYGWGGGLVYHEILVSAQGPLNLGFWVWGFRVWGLGLTIRKYLSLSLFVHPTSKVFDRFR